MKLWLGTVPEYAAEFLVMAVSMALVTSMDGTLNTAMQATGNIKVFQITVSIIMCMDIPFAYLFLSLGIEPYLVTGVSIFTAILCLFAKLIILRKQVYYNISEFIFSIVCKNFILSTLIIFIFLHLSHYIADSLLGFITLCFLSVAVNTPIIYVLGLKKSEREIIHSMIEQIISRFKNKKSNAQS